MAEYESCLFRKPRPAEQGKCDKSGGELLRIVYKAQPGACLLIHGRNDSNENIDFLGRLFTALHTRTKSLREILPEALLCMDSRQ
jgi:hypothetical protein